MPNLAAVPDGIITPEVSGSYLGGFQHIEFGDKMGRIQRQFVRKRWFYVMIVRPPILVSMCVVDLGYSATAFAFVYDDEKRKMLARISAVGISARVSDTAQEGCFANFENRKMAIALERKKGSSVYDARIKSAALNLDVHLESEAAPPSITAVREVEKGRINITEKRALLTPAGYVKTGAEEHPLDGGLAAYDYTHGLMPRRTIWNWAFLMGNDDRGEPIAINLVEGFMRESECAIFRRSGVTPVGEGQFSFTKKRPLDGWKIRTDDGVDLSFAPGALYEQHTNFGIVRSHFIQPAGVFSGSIAGVNVTRALGMVEDQNVLW